MAGGFEAFAGFVFAEETLVDGAFAGVVDLVGDTGKVGIEAGELQVVVDLVEEIPKRGRVAVAVAVRRARGAGIFCLIASSRTDRDMTAQAVKRP